MSNPYKPPWDPDVVESDLRWWEPIAFVFIVVLLVAVMLLVHKLC